MRISSLDERDCIEVLDRLGFGRLGCARDNQPYIVPIYFVCEDNRLYGFSTLGQKVQWMRANHQVCVQTDEVVSSSDWTSVVAVGRYEEILEAPLGDNQRNKVASLFEQRALGWQSIPYAASDVRGSAKPPLPVFYCIQIQKVSGLRATPGGRTNSFHEKAG